MACDNRFEAVAMGDGFRRFLDLIRLVRGVDLSKLLEVFDLIKQIVDAQDLKSRIELSIQLLKKLAAMTPTEADDRFLEVADGFLTPEVIEAIATLINGFIGKGEAQAQAVSVAACRQQVEAQGIPWSSVIWLAAQIYDLLQAIGVLP